MHRWAVIQEYCSPPGCKPDEVLSSQTTRQPVGPPRPIKNNKQYFHGFSTSATALQVLKSLNARAKKLLHETEPGISDPDSDIQTNLSLGFYLHRGYSTR